ncbi:hypothetical protein ACA29_24710 [Lederbergia galactosidilytica]|uniref:Uncharacterized protein n=1 Tax=Lederbergia galactosidilytica TaxID=217031 RepID=A0A0Q9XV32_9BACI|nr:hypothetical protein ACA29_24710 [Lederbergia galactosidilytica]
MSSSTRPLFFAILSKAQNIFTWTQEWKAHWEVEDILSSLKRGSDLLQQPSPNPESGPSQWVKRIQQAYSDVPPQNIYQLQEWARTRYQRLLGLAPIEREWRPLFQLFAAFESLIMLDSIATNSEKMEEMSFFVIFCGKNGRRSKRSDHDFVSNCLSICF